MTPHWLNYFRFLGYSGEDCPRSQIPSLLGVLEEDAAKTLRRVATEDAVMTDEAAPIIKYYSSRTEIERFRESMKITPLFQEDGMSKYYLVKDFLISCVSRSEL